MVQENVSAFFRVILPMLKPTMYSILILGVIYTFKVFDLVQVMTGGGPVNATENAVNLCL